MVLGDFSGFWARCSMVLGFSLLGSSMYFVLALFGYPSPSPPLISLSVVNIIFLVCLFDHLIIYIDTNHEENMKLIGS